MASSEKKQRIQDEELQEVPMVTRQCEDEEHESRFPHIPRALPETFFYGDQQRCMHCSDQLRLLDVLGKEERIDDVARVVERLTYSVEELQMSKAKRGVYLSAGRMQCLHPLHDEWCWKTCPNPPLFGLFAGSSAKVCNACIEVNAVMKIRIEARVRERFLQQRAAEAVAAAASAAAAATAVTHSVIQSNWNLGPVTPPSFNATPRSLQPQIHHHAPMPRNRGPQTSSKPDTHHHQQQQQQQRAIAAPPSRPKEVVAPRIDVIDPSKARTCKGCLVEYVFFPDHPQYNDLPAEWVCVNCIDRVVCFGCGVPDEARDDEMIMCDGCLLRGAHYPCLGLSEVPEGNWYCVDCVWKHERALIGTVWACSHCRSLNHSRWPSLANICLQCRKQLDTKSLELTWREAPSAFVVSRSSNASVRLPSQDEASKWSNEQIANFAFRWAYAGSPPSVDLRRSELIQCLEALGYGAREWMNGMVGERVEALGPEHARALTVLREAFDFLLALWMDVNEKDRFNPLGPKIYNGLISVPNNAPGEVTGITHVSLKGGGSSVDVDGLGLAARSLLLPSKGTPKAPPQELEWTDNMQELSGDGNEDEDVVEDDLGANGRKRSAPAVQRGQSLAPRVTVLGKAHSLLELETSRYERYAGRLVWVRIGDYPWTVGQLYVERDIPPEFTVEVLALRQALEENHCVLVMLFTRPLRTFAWALPEIGEVSEFRIDLWAHYMNFAALERNSELLETLYYARRTVSLQSLGAPDCSFGWSPVSTSLPKVLGPGTLVWAKFSPGEPWWPGTISMEHEVPPELLPKVLASRRGGASVLVLFFDWPVNRFGYVEHSEKCLMLFRSHISKVSTHNMSQTLVQCVQRALIFELVYIPSSTTEGVRWICEAACGVSNHPFRSNCFLCGLKRNCRSLHFRAGSVFVTGYPVLNSPTVSFSAVALKVNPASENSVFIPFCSVHSLVFALSSPRPFLWFRFKEDSVTKWCVLILSDDPATHPWTLASDLQSWSQSLVAFEGVIVVQASRANAASVFPSPQCWDDPSLLWTSQATLPSQATLN